MESDEMEAEGSNGPTKSVSDEVEVATHNPQHQPQLPLTRMVLKHGRLNLKHNDVRAHPSRILFDVFHTIVDAKWRWTLASFCATYYSSWLLFALVWWLIALTHGDLEPEHLPEAQSLANWTPCVFNITGFTSCFLYSIEVQHTTGFGVRMTSEKCPDAVFLTCAQSIVGVILEAFMVGVIFTKIARPKKRAETLVFSKNAVICSRDGQLMLQVRVGDTSKTRIVEAHVRGILIQKRVTSEGEDLSPFDQREIRIGTEEGDDRVLLIWPTTLVHRIDERSPFHGMTANDLVNADFELVVVLEGIVETTGLSIQARQSYLPHEILWGRRLPTVLAFDKKAGSYVTDYTKFHETVPVRMPTGNTSPLTQSRCSGQRQSPCLRS